MNKFLLGGILIAGIVIFGGCKTNIGGPEIDNKTNTYPNQIEARNLNSLNNPAPNEAAH